MQRNLKNRKAQKSYARKKQTKKATTPVLQQQHTWDRIWSIDTSLNSFICGAVQQTKHHTAVLCNSGGYVLAEHALRDHFLTHAT
jgi:hypothetical protein